MEVSLKAVNSIFYRYQNAMSFCIKNGHSYQIRITENTISIYDCDDEEEVFFELLPLDSLQMRHFINAVRLDFIKHHYIHSHKLQLNLHYLKNTRFSLSIDVTTPEQLGDAVLHDTLATLAHAKDHERLETEQEVRSLKAIYQNYSEFDQTCLILENILKRIHEKTSNYRITLNHFDSSFELLVVNNQTNSLLYSTIVKGEKEEISAMVERIKQVFLKGALIYFENQKEDASGQTDIISNRNLELAIQHQTKKENQKAIVY